MNSGWTRWERRINFELPFRQQPQVMVSLGGENTNPFISLTSVLFGSMDIDTHGFTLLVWVPGGANGAGVVSRWMAMSNRGSDKHITKPSVTAEVAKLALR